MKPLRHVILASLAYASACKTVESSASKSADSQPLLGDHAYAEACRGFESCPEVLRRRDGTVTYSYGQLVAFVGDFYATPQEFYEDRTLRNVFAPYAADAATVKDLFSHEVDAIEAKVKGDRARFPDFNINFVLAYPRNLEIASNNVEHFGWHNMKAYARFHSQALALALQARKDRRNGPRLFEQALVYNAFADHFLGDGFSSGHIRVPRLQSLKWQREKGYGQRAVSALAKILHDTDHPADWEGGLPVMNARGDRWKTQDDGSLYRDVEASRIAREALAISVKEVVDVYEGKEPPAEVFRAIELVPFPEPTVRGLADDFPADMHPDKMQELLKGLGTMWKIRTAIGLNEGLTREYFGALPQLMRNFQADVRVDMLDAELAKRLPPAYVDGYLKIR